MTTLVACDDTQAVPDANFARLDEELTKKRRYVSPDSRESSPKKPSKRINVTKSPSTSQTPTDPDAEEGGEDDGRRLKLCVEGPRVCRVVARVSTPEVRMVQHRLSFQRQRSPFPSPSLQARACVRSSRPIL